MNEIVDEVLIGQAIENVNLRLENARLKKELEELLKERELEEANEVELEEKDSREEEE